MGTEVDTVTTFSTSINQKALSLSAADKWRLVRPLVLRYMLPLCENTICASVTNTDICVITQFLSIWLVITSLL
jgi:hypothetical protein